MAEEKDIKRIYNIPLRKGFLKSAKWKRSKKAMKVLKEFLARHMKTDIKNVLIGKNLNEHVWKNGIRNPPHHVKVEAIKDKDGIVKTELEGYKYESFKKEGKDEKKGALAKAVDKLKGSKEDKKPKKEVKEAPKEEKKETKPEVKKEEPKEDKTEIKETTPKKEKKEVKTVEKKENKK